MATMPQFLPSEVVHDLDFPQREAAFFYGLFLRGYSAEQLRRECQVVVWPGDLFGPSGSRHDGQHLVGRGGCSSRATG